MIGLEKLIALSLGEVHGDEEWKIEDHVLACGACAAVFETLLRIRDAVPELVGAGRFAFPLTSSLARELTSAKLITRSYYLTPNAVVACTVGANDIFSMTTIAADLRQVEHLDVVLHFPMGVVRMEDVPFDASKGEVSYVARADLLRRFPSGRIRLELLGHGRGEPRKISESFLEHTAFAGA